MNEPVRPKTPAADPSAPELSVIIPCFNESRRLAGTLPEVVRYFSARPETFEIIIVDDGSRDDTALVAARLGGAQTIVERLPENRGKGAAVKAGVARSRGRIVLFTDADLSTPITTYADFRARIPESADIVIGSRAVREADVRVHQPLWRESLGRLFNRVIRLLGVRGIRDTQCGFKLFRGELARTIFPQTRVERWVFDVEVLLIAHLLGQRIAEVGVTWNNSADSRVSVWKDLFRTVTDLLRLRFFWLFHRPKSEKTVT